MARTTGQTNTSSESSGPGAFASSALECGTREIASDMRDELEQMLACGRPTRQEVAKWLASALGEGRGCLAAVSVQTACST